MPRRARRHSDVSCATTAEPIDRNAVWIMDSVGAEDARIRGVPDFRAKRQFLGKKDMPENKWSISLG